MVKEKTLNEAIHFAKEYHLGQCYGDIPYYKHLEETSNFIEEMMIYNNDSEILQVAWLHDVVEDTNVTYDDLDEFGFSDKVVEGVRHITKEKGEKYFDYIDKVKSDEYAHIVKIADTFCNLRNSIKENNIKRIRKYTNQLKFLYDGNMP